MSYQKRIIELQNRLIEKQDEQLNSVKSTVVKELKTYSSVVESTVKSQMETYSSTVAKSCSSAFAPKRRLLFGRLKIKRRGAKTSSSMVLTSIRMNNYKAEWRLFSLKLERNLSSRTAAGSEEAERMQSDQLGSLLVVKLMLHKY